MWNVLKSWFGFSAEEEEIETVEDQPPRKKRRTSRNTFIPQNTRMTARVIKRKTSQKKKKPRPRSMPQHTSLVIDLTHDSDYSPDESPTHSFVVSSPRTLHKPLLFAQDAKAEEERLYKRLHGSTQKRRDKKLSSRHDLYAKYSTPKPKQIALRYSSSRSTRQRRLSAGYSLSQSRKYEEKPVSYISPLQSQKHSFSFRADETRPERKKTPAQIVLSDKYGYAAEETLTAQLWKDVCHEEEENRIQRKRLALSREYEQRRSMRRQSSVYASPRPITKRQPHRQYTITPAQAKIIRKTLKGYPDEVLVKGFNADLTRADLSRLGPGQWLNDEIINYYIQLLGERNAKLADCSSLVDCHFFNTFFLSLLTTRGKYQYPRVRKWTRKVDLFAKDKVLIPVHLGNHWCLAVINIRDKRFEYYDSLGGKNPSCIATLRRYLVDEAKDKKSVDLDLEDWVDYAPGRNVPQQQNSYDCGVFTCKYADRVSHDAKFEFSQKDMSYFRKRLLLDILAHEATID
eukprot:TRINITY_DN8128_c0_g1_i1.p1 TRINITY_DN8128_c0_g1~~TRINITY_DN8128_c0_g1_i1.p1  ORF type:complete len:514 (+),score=59.98 TRINITY_DN8128_c0_g1_i1:326-1867(+)